LVNDIVLNDTGNLEVEERIYEEAGDRSELITQLSLQSPWNRNSLN
jgi:hypothetical protein